MAELDRGESLAELEEPLGWRERWEVHPIEPSALLAEVGRLMREAGEEGSNRDFHSFRIRTAS